MRKRRPFFNSDFNEDETSLTPLIDVVFVVLILFILVAPMVEIDRIHLASAPTREVADTVSPSNLAIHVRSDNTIWIGKQSVPPDRIRTILIALHQNDPKLHPQLYQDRKAAFGTYQLVKNAVEEAGFAELEIVLEPN